MKVVGGALFIIGTLLAFLAHYPDWYSPFIVGGFLFFEGVNMKNGFSILKHAKKFFRTWLIFIGTTIVIEIIGKWWLKFWDYPSLGELDYIIHVLLIGYAFTGFFGLEFFVWLQGRIPSKKVRIVILPLAAFAFGYVNEYPNTFAHEWRYMNWPFGSFLKIPILVSFLWLLLILVLCFKSQFRELR